MFVSIVHELAVVTILLFKLLLISTIISRTYGTLQLSRVPLCSDESSLSLLVRCTTSVSVFRLGACIVVIQL